MNSNPFYRLKHYKIDRLDPAENHATNCLAFCLQISEPILKSFLAALYKDFPQEEVKWQNIRAIKTQHALSPNRLLDLVLESAERRVVVEAKIGSSEDSGQLSDYREALKKTDIQTDLFSLIRGDRIDPVANASIKARVLWNDLRDRFQQDLEDFPKTDQELVRSLIEYLGLVGAFMRKDERGGRRNKKFEVSDHTVESVYADLVKALPECVSCPPFKDKQLPPTLPFGFNRWGAIFGSPLVHRILLYYTQSGYKAKGEFGVYSPGSFYMQILLEDHIRCRNWEQLQLKLGVWIPYLWDCGFSVVMSDPSSRHRNKLVKSLGDLKACPKFLYGSYRDCEANEVIPPLNADAGQILSLLTEAARRIIGVVDALPCK